MSDPVTNVEIEDVLSSIRRLVSDGDKARTRDPAPTEDVADDAPKATDTAGKTPESKPAKFVLTPAFMVVSNDATPDTDQDTAVAGDDEPENDHVEDDHVESDEDDQDAEWVEELPDEPDAAHDEYLHHNDEDAKTVSDFETDNSQNEDGSDSIADEVAFDGDHIAVEDDAADDAADVVWGSVDEARKIGLAAVPEANVAKANTNKTLDRSGLIASIAELEAAVSKDVQDFEPDGSETADEMMGETIAWPGTVKRNTENVQDVEDSDVFDDGPTQDAQSVAFEHRTAPADDTPQDDAPQDDTATEPDAYDDDDLDDFLDAGTASMDQDALRALVSEIVREELTGPMGERITRNVRKLVRREIYRILSSQEFD